ncbi:hypothetical protein PUNSTDRAFT_133760 [Punctularia strigosozonata HHB-11173 SS5]|uniref:uncharacterized protein n=1 Tax=Punctularia strigosozonata (strain HHB-11173) TaxID=741275 RepID=UPI0004418632|nr:uncharacterized protein PUNSTDRAFT_133760 [Punctularia strigosozonata HHB-11173 SS5]EIN09991.1 hypothetical protein PUNSTDRAFT_133760 [Punctularia strigosozonata HHB-11173 SS5]
MSSLGAQLAELERAIGDAFVVNLATAGALAWLAYDTILTFTDEIELVWNIYFYGEKLLQAMTEKDAELVPVNSSTTIKYHPRFCHFYFWFDAANTSLLPTLIGEALMAMRLYALYYRSRTILALLVLLYCAEVATTLWAVITTISSIKLPVVPKGIPLPGCLSSQPSFVPIVIAGAVPLLVASVFFMLMMYKSALTHARTNTAGSTYKVGFGVSRRLAPTLYVFFRDGSAYFFMVLVVESLVIFFTVYFNGRQLSVMYQPWVMSTYAIASTRLVLHLRGSVMHFPGLETISGDMESKPQFATPSNVSYDGIVHVIDIR